MLRFLVFTPLALAFASCAHPGPYKRGYQTFSYTVRGQTYHPMDVEEALDHNEVGIASWYNESSWLGLKRGNTSLGEKVMPWHIIAAHKTLPLPAKVRVTNLENGKDVVCRVNDRGPFIGERIIDLSPRAARILGFIDDGLTMVEVEVLSVGDGKHQRKRKKNWFFGLF